MSRKQFDGKVVKKILNFAVPTAVFAAAALYIAGFASYEVALEASINGTPCGYVEAYTDLSDAKSNVETTVYNATDGAYSADIEVAYELVNVRSPKYLTKAECLELIWSEVEDDFTEAYMLYVDDRQAAAYESREELDALIASIEADLLASVGEGFSAVKINNRVRIEKQLCLNTAFKSLDEINDLLNPLAAEELEAAKANADNKLLTIGSLKAAAPSDEESASVTDGLTLEYNFVNTVTLDEEIPYGTSYVEDYDNYVGYEKLVSRGTNGKRTVTYEIVYDTEGNIIGRNELSETIITPAKDRVIAVGAKPLPEAVPTGTFIWPCESPYGISSPFGWRVIYGKKEFHLGIDLPNAVGTPIYASDGGKVVFAGFSPSYGYNVRIEHADGYSTTYAHLSKVLVRVGDMVYQGQEVGKMGNTGVSYGSHLHFEIRINGEAQDPELFLPKEKIELTLDK